MSAITDSEKKRVRTHTEKSAVEIHAISMFNGYYYVALMAEIDDISEKRLFTKKKTQPFTKKSDKVNFHYTKSVVWIVVMSTMHIFISTNNM